MKCVKVIKGGNVNFDIWGGHKTSKVICTMMKTV